jgi:hypothetical protein
MKQGKKESTWIRVLGVSALIGILTSLIIININKGEITGKEEMCEQYAKIAYTVEENHQTGSYTKEQLREVFGDAVENTKANAHSDTVQKAKEIFNQIIDDAYKREKKEDVEKSASEFAEEVKEDCLRRL